MAKSVKVAGCQLPDVRGDVQVALSHVLAFADEAENTGVKLLVFPECFLQGYMLADDESRRLALDLDSSAFDELLNRLKGTTPVLVLGLVERVEAALFNTAVVIRRGELLGRYRKTHLLRSERVFEPGNACPVFDVDGLRFGINICYDLRFPEGAAVVAEHGADLLVAPCNNMLALDKAEEWKHLHNEIRAERTKETGLWLLSSDVMGERDGKVSYGPTAFIDPSGNVRDQVPLHEVGMVVREIPCRER